MSEQYAREVLRRNVAQICQTIGWNGINSTPLDIMIHVLEKYIQTLGTQTNRYAEQFNRTEPNLNDLGLVFRDLNVQLPELAEFTRCVPSIAPPVSSERFPKPKESNLNFLKPGSHEVVTRPMHVHEHLPPMYPEKEQDTPAVAGTVEIRHNGIETVDGSSAVCPEVSTTDSPDKAKDPFKRPTDPVSLPANKRPRLRLEEEERTREISSVMMTMSGFLSPAREGKLPEARPPVIISEKHDKHKTNVHHSNAAKVPVLEKSDKKSKKNKLLNGKIMKSKRKDKSHKSDSGKNKDSKQSKYPPGFLKSKETHNIHNHLPPTNLKAPVTPKPAMPPPPVPVPELIRPVIKQEVLDPALMPKNIVSREDTIPVPRKIPISKSPLVSNPTPAPKNQTSTSTAASDIEIKKEVDEDVKLASQPDRSKINIFKRISNKSKEDKNSSDLITDKSPSTVTTPRLQDMIPNSENVRAKPEETIVVNNNDNNAVDLSKEMDLRAHEVISIDDDSLERNPALAFKNVNIDRPNLSLKQSLQVPYSKDVASISPKVKKEKKHKDKKDKAAKLEAKLLKKQQQQLAYEMAQTDKQTVRMQKAPKGSRAKNEPKMPQLPHGFPFFPSRNLIPGPGLIPNSGLIPGSDFLTGLANNPALRGLASPAANLLSNPYALSASGPGLIPGSGFLSGNLGSGLTNPVPMRHMANFPHSSRSSMTIPPMLRRPSLEVIPVDNDEDRHKSLGRDKERHDKHKSPTIPNILQKHKSKYKDNKPNLLKMPPVQPDITIELNPPKVEPVRQEPIKKPPPMKSPTPEPIIQPKLETSPTKPPMEVPPESENIEKKKDKSHKKEKKDKDSTKIKKKKDKKDKNKDKSEKKREKEEKHGLKDKIKKEKKEKKKEKPTDGVIPKLTLKLGSSNSNSPMPPSSPDVFKLNIKPVVKKDDNESSLIKEEDVSRDHSPSPELAQISALVTRPPKLKHLKHNHVGEEEPQSSPPPSVSSPPRKNRPPSSHSNSAKYKRILFKPLSKKSNFEDDTSSISEDTAAPTPDSTEPSGPLPTPYYLDEQGNKIWVCPACGRPDNGSPMIGCDGCDGWYHWVCVGITVEPGATEDWFCKLCKAKLAGKKRGRKPKGEKIRDCH